MNEFAHIQLEDLTVIKTLGVGGFGRVELVNLVINYDGERKWSTSRFHLGSFLVFPINLLISRTCDLTVREPRLATT